MSDLVTRNDRDARDEVRGDTRFDERDEIVVIEASEARRSFATSELWVYLIAVVALLFFTYESGTDSLTREEGWRYATALSVGYLLSRGLAKAGSSEPRQRTRRF